MRIRSTPAPGAGTSSSCMRTPAYACSANVRVHSSTRGRPTLWKHRVTRNDIERRAPSSFETGWLNQGVLRALRALGVCPFGGRQPGLPLFRLRLRPFRRGREIGPFGKVLPPCHPAPAPRRVGALKQDQVPNPPAFVPGSVCEAAEWPHRPPGGRRRRLA
jgi:hypothetical protein